MIESCGSVALEQEISFDSLSFHGSFKSKILHLSSEYVGILFLSRLIFTSFE